MKQFFHLSWPFRFSTSATYPGIPLIVVIGYIVVFIFFPAAWQWPGIVALDALVQVLAVSAVMTLYWVPRLTRVALSDLCRARPIRKPWLVYLGALPPAAAAIGLAWQAGDVPGWFYLLGSAASLVAAPALVDALIRPSRDNQSEAEAGQDDLGSGPVGGLLPLGDFDMSVPRNWLPLPNDPVPGWSRTGVGLLSNDERTRAELARTLERVRAKLMAQPHLEAWVWAPAQTRPKLAGTMTAARIVPPEGQRLDREHYRALIEPEHRHEITVYGRHIDEVDLPVGPAVRVSEVIAQPRTSWSLHNDHVVQNLAYTVFPRGCSDALRLTFRTSVVELIEPLEADAARIVHTLTVGLGEEVPS